jgi:hypothetical protein
LIPKEFVEDFGQWFHPLPVFVLLFR